MRKKVDDISVPHDDIGEPQLNDLQSHEVLVDEIEDDLNLLEDEPSEDDKPDEFGLDISHAMDPYEEYNL